MLEPMTLDTIVVGAGPAGLSAALTLGRARRRVLVLDSGEPRNHAARHMHGVLGHDGLDPAELRAKGEQELARYGIEVRRATVDPATRPRTPTASRSPGSAPAPSSSPPASSTTRRSSTASTRSTA